MSNRYQKQIDSSSAVIARKGQAMRLYSFSNNGYNPLEPEDANPSYSSPQNCNGVVLPASNGTIEAFDNRILSDPDQRIKFRFVILSGKGLVREPKAQDLLVTNEGNYRILGATPLNPSGEGAIIFNVGATLDISLELPTTFTFSDTTPFFGSTTLTFA